MTPAIVVHCVDPARHGWPVVQALRTLLRFADDVEHRVVVAGDGAGRALCQLHGVPVAAVLPALAGSRRSLRLAIRRVVDVVRDGREAVVQPWSPGIAEAAAEAGAAPVAAAVDPREPLPVDVCEIEEVDGSALRRRLGIGDEAVVVAAGEPDRTVDASTASYHAGVSSICDRPTSVVVPSGARDIDRALRFVEHHFGAWRVIIADLRIAEQVAIAHALLLCADPTRSLDARSRRTDATAHGIHWAMAAGTRCAIELRPPPLHDDERVHPLAEGTRLETTQQLMVLLDEPAPAPVDLGPAQDPAAWCARLRDGWLSRESARSRSRSTTSS